MTRTIAATEGGEGGSAGATLTAPLKTSFLGSLVLSALLRAHCLTCIPGFTGLWNRVYAAAARCASRPVVVRVHGIKLVQTFGFTYPIVARRFPHFNDPLVELVRTVSVRKERRVRVVDVGAAIGDTAVLLATNCPGAIAEIVCLDGDAEFFPLLLENLRRVPNARALRALLSSDEGEIPELRRIHAGTASAQGLEKVKGERLDSVLSVNRVGNVDVLKTDVDGFDGRVLAGSVTTLKTMRPEVIFEWHPPLYGVTGSSTVEPFEVLEDCGYDRFIWYTKYGLFSHFSTAGERGGMALLENICRESDVFPDWHYDVIALHRSSPIRPEELAALRNGSLRTVPV